MRRALENGSRRGIRPGILTLCVASLFLGGCGYHVAGRGTELPAAWKTLAVPAFTNRTPHYRIEQRITAAVIRELEARTSYRIVPEARTADAVLHGEITGIETSPVLFDATTGHVTTMLVTVRLKVSLDDRATGKALYTNDNFVFRDEYQISSDVATFFEEESPALDRLSRDFAADLVSNLLEGF